MELKEFAQRLNKLVDEGLGDRQVYLTTNDVDTPDLIKGRFVVLDKILED